MNTSKTILLAALFAFSLGCGYSAKPTTPAVAGTMPTVSALAPNSVTAGSPSFVLTVNGTNFNSNAAINLNGAAEVTSHVSANQLTATVPSATVATAGTVTITVTNPGTSGGIYGGGTAAETSNSMTFTIN
jgi:type IV pilus biogenesis protein CpaD/CtpE